MASTSAVTRVIEAVGPHRLVGAVVAGFKRGSKQLGWPTANLDPKVFEHRFDDSTEGVYVGWAAINDPTLPAESPELCAVLRGFALEGDAKDGRSGLRTQIEKQGQELDRHLLGAFGELSESLAAAAAADGCRRRRHARFACRRVVPAPSHPGVGRAGPPPVLVKLDGAPFEPHQLASVAGDPPVCE